MIEFTLTRTTAAPIEKVLDALTHHRGIADYVPLLVAARLVARALPHRTVWAPILIGC
jgi:uncharacterized protein YndB with AHSA1/START domain